MSRKRSKQSLKFSIPQELFTIVFQYSCGRELITKYSLVCKEWHSYINREDIWISRITKETCFQDKSNLSSYLELCKLYFAKSNKTHNFHNDPITMLKCFYLHSELFPTKFLTGPKDRRLSFESDLSPFVYEADAPEEHKDRPFSQYLNYRIAKKTVFHPSSYDRNVQSDMALPRVFKLPLLYFEVTLLASPFVAVGITYSLYSMAIQPGWGLGSVAYHCDDGGMYIQKGDQPVPGAACNKGDTVGCGFIPATSEVFFTRNGKLVNNWTLINPGIQAYPTVGMWQETPVAPFIAVNFGHKQFQFNLMSFGEQLMSRFAGSHDYVLTMNVSRSKPTRMPEYAVELEEDEEEEEEEADEDDEEYVDE